MPEEKTSIVVSQRRWVEKIGDVAAHYESPNLRVTFPARYLVQYEPTQHTLIIKDTGGHVRAVYREVTRMLTPDVIEESPAEHR